MKPSNVLYTLLFISFLIVNYNNNHALNLHSFFFFFQLRCSIPNHEINISMLLDSAKPVYLNLICGLGNIYVEMFSILASQSYNQAAHNY